MTMVESGTDSRRNSFHDQIRLGAGGKGKGEREGRRKGPSRNGSRRSSVSVQRKEEEQEPNASGNVGGPKGDSAFGGLDQGTFNRVKNATKLEDAAVIGRFHEFMKQFPSGGISVEAFNNLSSHVLKDDEVEDFTKNVFKMFDADLNGYLTFEEFTLATECHEVANSNPLEKLSWLFENVYDKVKIKFDQNSQGGRLRLPNTSGSYSLLLAIVNEISMVCKSLESHWVENSICFLKKNWGKLLSPHLFSLFLSYFIYKVDEQTYRYRPKHSKS